MSAVLTDFRAQTDATEMETDELAGIVASVCAKFPDSSRAEVEALVEHAFQHLKTGATVTAHLIPLTLNRSLRLMRESIRASSQQTGTVQCPALDHRAG